MSGSSRASRSSARITLTNYPILEDKGKVSALEAGLKAEGKFEIYRQRQDAEYVPDFDREINRLEGKKKKEETP
jgi:hypothetical protein